MTIKKRETEYRDDMCVTKQMLDRLHFRYDNRRRSRYIECYSCDGLNTECISYRNGKDLMRILG